jgi:hypothetical protein
MPASIEQREREATAAIQTAAQALLRAIELSARAEYGDQIDLVSKPTNTNRKSACSSAGHHSPPSRPGLALGDGSCARPRRAGAGTVAGPRAPRLWAPTAATSCARTAGADHGKGTKMNEATKPRAFLTKASGAQLDVLNDVANERSRQDVLWGGAEHDDAHHPAEFVGFIEAYAQRARAGIEAEGVGETRHRLVQVAALAVAAIESLDRNGG